MINDIDSPKVMETAIILPEVAAKARLYVASQAHDKEDASFLLEILGLKES